MDFTTLLPQQILELAKPCKEFEEVLKSYKSPGIDWSDPEKAISALRNYLQTVLQADKGDPEVEEDILQAPSRDGTELPVHVFRPANAAKDSQLPLVVLYFPGGFVLGEPMMLAPLAKSLVKSHQVIVAAPTYRLAPEHPFPVSVEDGWDTLSWIASNTAALRADPSKGFIVGGISSGSNITNVISHLARDKDLQPPITGVWLSCGGVRIAPKDAHLLPEQYQERNLSRMQDECVNSVTSSAGMEKFKKDALKADLNSRLFAPMIWSTEAGLGHKGFPKTYSQVAGIDTARDESLIFDDILKVEGIPTKLDLYPGLPHFFFYNFRSLPQSQQWVHDTIDGFAWLLKSE